MQFTIKIYENGKMIHKVRTHKLRRFLKKIRSIKWQNSMISVYLKVDYGKSIDSFGKRTSFYNDGEYGNKEDFWMAFNAFIE